MKSEEIAIRAKGTEPITLGRNGQSIRNGPFTIERTAGTFKVEDRLGDDIPKPPDGIYKGPTIRVIAGFHGCSIVLHYETEDTEKK